MERKKNPVIEKEIEAFLVDVLRQDLDSTEVEAIQKRVNMIRSVAPEPE